MAESDKFDSNIFEENENEWGQPNSPDEINYTVKQIDKIDPQKEWGSVVIAPAWKPYGHRQTITWTGEK